MNYRKIWEEHNGQKIPKGHHIHHIDGNKKNNSPENLQCCSPEEHWLIHYIQGDPIATKRGRFIQANAEARRLSGIARQGQKRGNYNSGDINPSKREDVREKMRGPRGPQINMKGRVGRKKGSIPWLKGLTKETDPRLKKIAENMSVRMKKYWAEKRTKKPESL